MNNKSGYSSDEMAKSRIMIGQAMYKAVEKEPANHYIGQKIKFGENEGRIIEIYPHFILCWNGFYRFTVSCKDLVTAGL